MDLGSIGLKAIALLQIISAVLMIVLILLQQGKGAEMGAAFGSGASGSVLSAGNGASAISRVTASFAACFFISTLLLSYFGNLHAGSNKSVLTTASNVKNNALLIPTPVAPTLPVR